MKIISPDPEMAQHSEFAPGTVPHMYLYNSDNCHYDLLVEDDSRLAILGFISMGDKKEAEVKEAEVKDLEVKEEDVQELEVKEAEVQEMDNNRLKKETPDDEWTTVNHSRRNAGAAAGGPPGVREVRKVQVANKDYKCPKCSF